MRIISWNVNGLRALERTSDWKFLLRESPDIFCLQETKAHPDQLSPALREPTGYHSFFASSEVRKGYSGVALYSKAKPTRVVYGMGIKRFDAEGRLVGAFYDNLAVLNVYFPNGGQGPERLRYKLDFYDAFLDYVNRLRKQGHTIVFCGDVNTAHEEIDLARPKENEDKTGFLPEERAWIDAVVQQGYLDAFRHLYPAKRDAYTYWDMKTHARERNVGWRLDYFFISTDLVRRLEGVKIWNTIYGSDHCPIELRLR